MGVQVGPIDKPSLDRLGIAASVVLEGRFPEVSCERTVGDPPCGLLELY